MAVEDKQGISRLEQVVEEISEAERAKELKKEHKRMKKKKRKENKCKFANGMAEKKEPVTNGHDVDSQEKENDYENDKENCENEPNNASKEEKPKQCVSESEVNGVVCEENAKEKYNVDTTPTECITNDCKTIEKGIENDKNSHTDTSLKESCYCGDDAKEKSHKKNGFINASEEKPRVQFKKAKGVSPNGYVTPPTCRSCGQQLSPRERYDRGRPDRGRDGSSYSEMCAKCAMNCEGGNRRSRKKVNKPKEVKKIIIIFSKIDAYGKR